MALVFTMTKGAIEQIVRVLAKDLGQRGITVNAIAPGPVDTPIFQDGKPLHVIGCIARQHPPKRIPQPDEISPLVSFLVGEDAEWINGQTIAVNGVRQVYYLSEYFAILTNTICCGLGIGRITLKSIPV